LDSTIFLFLVQDGVINGAIYALAAIALVLVFAVSRRAACSRRSSEDASRSPPWCRR
jgi:hypothetical protein